MDFRRKKRQPVDIGLIPMIDVLLVLLFFFSLLYKRRQTRRFRYRQERIWFTSSIPRSPAPTMPTRMRSFAPSTLRGTAASVPARPVANSTAKRLWRSMQFECSKLVMGEPE